MPASRRPHPSRRFAPQDEVSNDGNLTLRSAEGASRRARPSRQAGFAILPVLAIVLLLAMAALSVGNSARIQIGHVNTAEAVAEARALADAGIARAIFALLAMDAGHDETWPTGITLAGGSAEIHIQDQGGLVDINDAEPETLTELLISLGLDRAAAGRLADTVADWRDEDQFVRLNGAEADAYRRAGLEWRPRDGPFERVAEMQLVLGMSPELYRDLAPLVTVYGHRSEADPALAPEPVLLAIRHGDAEGVRTILAARPKRPAFSESRIFGIRSIGRAERGATFIRETMIRITRDPERPFQVFAWTQAPW